MHFRSDLKINDDDRAGARMARLSLPHEAARLGARALGVGVACLLLSGCSSDDETQPDAAEASTRVDSAEAERLRALGYVDVVESSDDSLPVGVVQLDAAKSSPGWTHLTNAHGCSAKLVTPEGEIANSWTFEPCFTWGNSVLLPNGDLLVVHRNPPSEETAEAVAAARELLRLSWDGELVWRHQLPTHHDVERTPSGQLATLTYGHTVLTDIHPTVPVREDFVALLSDAGALLERVSLLDLLGAGPTPFALRTLPPRNSKRDSTMEVDLTHANSIEWMPWPDLAERDALYDPSNVLICLRNQNAVVIVNWERKEIVWSWGPGELSGPHDATWLPNGHILIFDNGLGRGFSRVVEIDPQSGEIVWEYRAPVPSDLYTEQRGAAVRLANGNTLITASAKGWAFEVTRKGEIVWEFRNPDRSDKNKPIVIVRARRIEPSDEPGQRFERAD